MLASWQVGSEHKRGDIIHHGGKLYRVMKQINYAERMPNTFRSLAYYRPLTPLNNGTKNRPLPYVQGIDVYEGLTYAYEGSKYLRMSDSLNCYVEPNGDRASWELIE